MTFEGNRWRLTAHLLLQAYHCLTGTWITHFCVFICCLLSHVHTTKVKAKSLIEEKYVEGEQTCEVSASCSTASAPVLVLWLVFETLHFAFPAPLHAHQVGSCPSSPSLLLSRGLWGAKPCQAGAGHQKSFQHRQAIPSKLVAFWKSGKEISKVEKID